MIPQQKEIADKAKTADRQFEIAQKNKEFQPSVLAVQTGSTIRFPNLDEVKHNVYSFSPAQNIDIPLYSSSEKKIPEQKFEKPGIVVIGCKIHDWMISYIYVVDSPYFAVSKNGLAQIEKVPFGKYTLSAWHPNLRQKNSFEKKIKFEKNNQLENVELFVKKGFSWIQPKNR